MTNTTGEVLRAPVKEGKWLVSTILVPLDGSRLAEMALSYAEQLAQSTSAQLVLTRAVPLAILQSHDKDLVALDDARGYLDGVAERLTATGQSVRIYTSWGSPAAAILDQIDTYQVDLVVMGTHGRSGPGRWLNGSVADEVLRRASVPIVLIGPHNRQPWTHGPASILVPLDGSQLAESVLEAATALAAQFQADLTLLQVIPLPPPNIYADAYAGFDADAELQNAREYLDSVAARLRGQGLRVHVRAEVGEPSPLIAQVAEAEKAGLIVMATHGRSGLARIVLGSVATEALQLATAPLFLVRPSSLAAMPAPAPATPAPQASTVEEPGAGLVGVWLSAQDVKLLDRGLAELLVKPVRESGMRAAVGELRNRLARAEGASPTPVGARS